MSAGGALGPGSRALRFAAVGASGVLVNLGALGLLAGPLRLPDVVASALAVELSIAWNFVLHGAFTYRDLAPGAHAGRLGRALRFNLVCLLGLAIQVATFAALRLLLLRGLHREALGALRYPAQAAGIALATAWSWVGHLRITWRQRPAPRGAEA